MEYCYHDQYILVISNALMQSPRAMMDKRIDTAVSAGSIITEDQTALDSALDAIDGTLSAGSTSSGSTASGLVVDQLA